MTNVEARPNAVGVALTPVAVAVILAATYYFITHSTARLGDSEILNVPFLWTRTVQHLQLVGYSFVLAVAIALPTGVALAYAPRLWRLPVFALANLGQTVPSIAILALAFTFVGIGVRPTVGALTLYCLLPILRNTLVGITAVDPAVVDAARGMGMTRWEALRRIELPLAVPLIFAGLRTAIVLDVGTATLGNFVGSGGLGDVLASGIDSFHNRIVVVSAVLVGALALLADWAFGLLERALSPRI